MSPKGRDRRVVPQQDADVNHNKLVFYSSTTDTLGKHVPKRRAKPLQPTTEDRARSESPLFPPEEVEYPDSPLLLPEVNDAETNTTAWERGEETMVEVIVSQSPGPDDEGAIVLDPEYSERQYHRDPFTGNQREIWRPGDEESPQSTDYYGREGLLPLEKRWRLFQSNIGPIGLGNNKREPPRFVFLDDRAAYEVLNSDIQKVRLNREWPHDFSAQAKIRARRTHCGRPAIKDPLTSEYHSCSLGRNSTYSFTGEKNYKAIIYRVPPPPPPEPTVEELHRKRKLEDAANPELYNARAHGHNQYTPKDMMVKHGAPTFSRKKPRGDDDESLTSLKNSTPKMHWEKGFPYPEGGSRSGGSRAASVWSRSDTVASKAASVQPSAAGSNVSAVISTTNVVNLASFQAPPQQVQDADADADEDGDSDIELFPKAIAIPHPHGPTPASTIASSVEVPRQMGYINRRMHEQALAQETMNAVQNQDDVVRISRELAEANVALMDQAKEIERLKVAVEAKQSVIVQMQGVIDEQKRLIEEGEGEGSGA